MALHCPEWRMLFPFTEFQAAAVENDPSVVFALDPKLRIAYCNAAWDRFAFENGGEGLQIPAPIGRCVLDCIRGPLRGFYASVYTQVLRTGKRWEHLYECSSGYVYRSLAMQVLPMRKEPGLLVINSVRVEHPHEIPSCTAVDDLYRDQNGLIVMCGHCRRTRRNVSEPETWDWVAEYVSHLPGGVSHGLCGPCFEYHYGRQHSQNT